MGFPSLLVFLRKGFHSFCPSSFYIIVTNAYHPVFDTNQIYQRVSSWHYHCCPKNLLSLFEFLCRQNSIKYSILSKFCKSKFCSEFFLLSFWLVCHFKITLNVEFNFQILETFFFVSRMIDFLSESFLLKL